MPRVCCDVSANNPTPEFPQIFQDFRGISTDFINFSRFQRFMRTNENHKNTPTFIEILRKSTIFYGNPEKENIGNPKKIYENLWKLMKINEHTWKICKFRGNLWKFIEIPSKINADLRKINEKQRKYMKIHRNSQETYEISWDFIRKYRKSMTNPWKSTDNLCTWKLIEIQRKSMKFHGN